MWKRKQKTSALIFERFLILYVRKAEEEANAAGEALDLLDIVDPLNVVFEGDVEFDLDFKWEESSLCSGSVREPSVWEVLVVVEEVVVVVVVVN